MPSIKTSVYSFAGESVVQDILNAANASTPPNVIPQATVNRDANGKVISVDVGLPVDIAKADFDAAMIALSNTPGVAQTQPAGVDVFNSDCNGLTTDTVYTSLTDGGGKTCALTNVLPNPSYGADVWQGGHASESVGGTGSCLRLTDTSSTGLQIGPSDWSHIMYGQITFDGPTNGLSSFNAFEVQFDIKYSATITNSGGSVTTAGHGDTFEFMEARIYLPSFGPSAYAALGTFTDTPPETFLGTYVNLPGGVTVPTGVQSNAYCRVLVRQEASGLTTFKAAATGSTPVLLQSANAGFSPMINSLLVVILTEDRMNSSAALNNQRPVMIDNVIFRML